MTPRHLLAVVALLVGFAAFLILSKPLWWKETARGVDPALIERMQERLRELERGQEATRAGLDDVAKAVRDLERTRHAASSDGAVLTGAATEPEGAPDIPAGRGAASRGSGAPLTVASAFAALTAKGATWEDREALWKRIREAGLLDAVVAEFERRAKEAPSDPQIQTELGEAYLKKTEEVGQTAEAGTWATKADRAFDKALELDPEHWEARFVKAMALSFWPAVFGKQTEAIKHFETLVAQQERQAPRAGFDDTYLMLGNMYQQMGKADQALGTWQRGLQLFPDNADLRQQIANADRLRR
jgi:tetratricopeptide (TPR) repeat protein